MKKHRQSKYEILKELFKEQKKDRYRSAVWNEIIIPHVLREYDFLTGRGFRHKAFDVLFRLRWKDEWIAKSMRVTVRTVRRVRRELKKMSS